MHLYPIKARINILLYYLIKRNMECCICFEITDDNKCVTRHCECKTSLCVICHEEMYQIYLKNGSGATCPTCRSCMEDEFKNLESVPDLIDIDD
jgi:hypothetical protein